VLAELIQRATGRDFREVVRDRVLGPSASKLSPWESSRRTPADVQEIVTSGERPIPTSSSAPSGSASFRPRVMT